MKFKVDENLPVEAADLLRKAGHEADTVQEEGLSGADDEALSERIRLEGRAIITGIAAVALSDEATCRYETT